jgi:hypothetical protein
VEYLAIDGRPVYHFFLIVAPPLAFTAGLFSFVSSIEQLNSPTQSHRTDAIVVLTGGAARISDALELLEHGHGELVAPHLRGVAEIVGEDLQAHTDVAQRAW